MTTHPVRASIVAEQEPQGVGYGGGLALRSSPGVEITASWDYGDHENALRVLTRLYHDARAKILAAAYPELNDGEARAIAYEATQVTGTGEGVTPEVVRQVFAAAKRVKHHPVEDIAVPSEAP